MIEIHPPSGSNIHLPGWTCPHCGYKNTSMFPLPDPELNSNVCENCGKHRYAHTGPIEEDG